MKNLVAFALILLVSLTVSAQKREIPVNDFSKISFGTSGTLYLTQGSENSVVIEASDELFERIEVVGSGSRLTIRTKNGSWKSWSGGSLTAYVTMKNLDGVDVSGSGNIEGKNKIQAEDVDINVSGSGSVQLDLDAEDIDIRISGSGKVYLDGSADSADARISGSGKVKAEDFVVDTFIARISGSGDCYITANEKIDADISGSGNVYYKGRPSKLNSNSSGSGGIKRM